MTRDEFAALLDKIQAAEREVRAQGQEEYAHAESNAFRNFEDIATELELSREEVLWIYLRKHMDGILAWLKGKRSQREDVRGRIKDARLYLALLWGMVNDEEEQTSEAARLFNSQMETMRAEILGKTAELRKRVPYVLDELQPLEGPRYSDLAAAPTRKE